MHRTRSTIFGPADEPRRVVTMASLEPSAAVTRVIYLAFLAPDIVQCIVRGEHPIGLGTKKLLAMAPLPLDWNEQRRVLGFG